MSIRPTLLLILAVTLGSTMWITYTLTEQRGKYKNLVSNVENRLDQMSRIQEQVSLYMERLYLITDLANVEDISHGFVLL